MSDIDVQALAREIASRMAPDALLDTEDVAALIKVAPRVVLEQYVPEPGFPKPIRLTRKGGGKGQPRWQRKDIMAWIESHKNGRTKRGGRPRASTEL